MNHIRWCARSSRREAKSPGEALIPLPSRQARATHVRFETPQVSEDASDVRTMAHH